MRNQNVSDKNYFLFIENDTKIVKRGCTLGGGFQDFCHKQENADSSITCMWCNRDSCNAANYHKMTTIIGFVIGSIFYVFSIIF